MTAQQKAASEKAARILKLIDIKTGSRRYTEIVNASDELHRLSDDGSVATALIDAHAEIERLKGAAREYIDAVDAWGRIGVNRPERVHNAAAKRRTAALDALKEIAG